MQAAILRNASSVALVANSSRLIRYRSSKTREDLALRVAESASTFSTSRGTLNRLGLS